MVAAVLIGAIGAIMMMCSLDTKVHRFRYNDTDSFLYTNRTLCKCRGYPVLFIRPTVAMCVCVMKMHSFLLLLFLLFVPVSRESYGPAHPDKKMLRLYGTESWVNCLQDEHVENETFTMSRTNLGGEGMFECTAQVQTNVSFCPVEQVSWCSDLCHICIILFRQRLPSLKSFGRPCLCITKSTTCIKTT